MDLIASKCFALLLLEQAISATHVRTNKTYFIQLNFNKNTMRFNNKKYRTDLLTKIYKKAASESGFFLVNYFESSEFS